MTEEWWIWCKRRHAKEATSVNEVTNLYQANELNQYTNINEGAVEPVYDADGNMTSYGSLQFTWDAENRLVKVAPHYLITGSRIYEYEYDYMSRRVKKTEKRYTMPMSTWTYRSFDYDGWNLVRERVEFDGTVSTNQYVWGLDLSGTLQGAGGVGGLLAILSPDSRLLTPAYDANGNITDLVDTNGSVVAHYEYDPYGNTIAQSGDYADLNPLRFSSKYWDGETEFYYYGYRYYSPEMGRWINKDPLGDKAFVKSRSKRGRFYGFAAEALSYLRFRRDGFHNLYRFVRNRPIDAIDLLGLACTVHFKCTLVSATDQGKCDKHCEYSCVEDNRTDSFGGSLMCDDLPQNISMTQGSTASGSLLCKLTKGKCGKKGECPSDYTTNRIYDNWDIGDRDCSRSECIAGCNAVADAAKKACKKLKGPAKTACKNAAELARTICIDGCNAWCENP